jgi:anthranilate phosphoribosyltransferase
MKALLERLLDGHALDAAEAERLLSHLTDPSVEDAWKGAVLAAIRVRGVTADEVLGLARGMRAAARPVDVDRDGAPLVDTAGTGGDHSGAINLSTAASLVAAAAGARVVKHGNRSVSSKSGSADVLEALGIAVARSPDAAGEQLRKTGYTFLFAPVFHPAMGAVVPVRRALAARTVFNLLGPLTNPARPPFQLIGVFSPEAGELIATAASGLGIERAWVLHGAPGWDEATPVGPFHRWEVRPGSVEHRLVDPELAYGVPRCAPEDLVGGDPLENAEALRRIFQGCKGPQRDAVVLNAALALEVASVASGRDAVDAAMHAIDSGAVIRLLEALGHG